MPVRSASKVVVVREVTRPSLSTVITGMKFGPPTGVVGRPEMSASSELPTAPGLICRFRLSSVPVIPISDPEASFGSATRFALIFSVVAGLLMTFTMLLPAVAEIVGFGYDPVRSPPAGPLIPGRRSEALAADVRRPCASTVMTGMVVSDPYEPGATPVMDILEEVTAPSLMTGFGYESRRSPPAGPRGSTLTESVFREIVSVPAPSATVIPCVPMILRLPCRELIDRTAPVASAASAFASSALLALKAKADAVTSARG